MLLIEVLELIYVFLLPGYLTSYVLITEISWIERFFWGSLFGIIIVPLVVYILNKSAGIPINSATVVFLSTTISCLMGFVLWLLKKEKHKTG